MSLHFIVLWYCYNEVSLFVGCGIVVMCFYTVSECSGLALLYDMVVSCSPVKYCNVMSDIVS